MRAPIVIGTAAEAGLLPDQCPFPGISSYDLDQRYAFKGREQESIELARVILSQRLTVLTAGSGDGKTSLIHAGLAPLLMREGIEVAVAEPGGQSPVALIGDRLLGRMLPFASENLATVRWLASRGLRGSLRRAREVIVHELRSRPRGGSVVSSERFAALPDHWPSERPIDLFQGGPLRSWLTNADIPDRLVDAAMVAVARQCRARAKPKWPGLDASMKDAIGFFEHIPPKCERTRLGFQLRPERLKNIVLKQLQRAFELHAERPGYELVLVIDQFEEIFVQYRGSKPGFEGDPVRDRREHREALLALLSLIEQRSEWPMRIVLSMRKEHYAELEAAARRTVEGCTYHLWPLHKEQALDSLMQLAPRPRGSPKADAAGMKRWRKFVAKALNQLAANNEGIWVDATELSSLGLWLWGRELPADVEDVVKQALRRQVEEILEIKGEAEADGSLSRDPKADGQVKSPPPVVTNAAELHEALAILAQLRTPYAAGGSRRINLPISALGARPWRSQPFTRKMIERLRRANLIRQETRHGQDYVEIVHERMIDVIDDLQQQLKDPQYSELDPLLELLSSSMKEDPFRRIPLTPNQLATLAANRERLALSDFAASRIVDAMLASRALWKPGQEQIAMTADFLKWLAACIDSETASIVALDTATPEARKEISERAQATWRAGELASPALTRAMDGCDVGLGEDDLRMWLLMSSLLHGRAGQKRVQELAAAI
jgi:hypothetical protein